MKKTFLVLKHELTTILTRPSFLIMAIGIPVVTFLIFSGVSAFNRRSPGQLSDIFSGPETLNVEGYVDAGGIIAQLPSGTEQLLKAYSTEDTARQALSQEEISSYYIIPNDYLETGEIIYIRSDFNPLAGEDQSKIMDWVLTVNLLGDENMAMLIRQPMTLQQTSLSTEVQRDEDNLLTFFVPYAVAIIFYVVILMSASLLLKSVTTEKENRMIETLLTSVTPLELLRGKIIGLGIAGLIQTVVWVGTGRLLVSYSGQTMNIPDGFELPPFFLAWGVVFFIFGYAVNASLMAGMGALMPNMKESSQATLIVIAPMLIPLFLVTVLIEEPHGAFSLGLSLFPLTSPIAMMTRLSAGGVPLWQPLLACGLLGATVVIVIRMVARMFHAQTLLSGQTFNVGRYFKALLGRG